MTDDLKGAMVQGYGQALESLRKRNGEDPDLGDEDPNAAHLTAERLLARFVALTRQVAYLNPHFDLDAVLHAVIDEFASEFNAYLPKPLVKHAEGVIPHSHMQPWFVRDMAGSQCGDSDFAITRGGRVSP